MKYIVAVSGGVDSVVLLDKLARQDDCELIVAHVDHGIRASSGDDARFVRALAARYGLAFEVTRLELGVSASEDVARQARYGWLFDVAKRYSAMLVTAHHADDVVESIAINLTRGTGWRGLAVMNRQGIIRPMRDLRKAEIYNYALSHHLEWVEDETNTTDRYLRNRLRYRTAGLSDDIVQKLGKLRQRQIGLSKDVDDEVKRLLPTIGNSRYFYTMLDDKTAYELLRQQVMATTEKLLDPPRIMRALLMIKTARPQTWHDLGEGVMMYITKDHFVVENHL